jgi:hypothetical protein
MAYDRYEIEHHLTPAGWVSGSDSDQTSHTTVKPPGDRVETWLMKMRQSSGWAPEDITWQRIWFNPIISEEKRAALRKSFSAPGRNFPST